jgi:hypothetical protein
MLKAVLLGGELVLLGLSEEDVRRLRQDQPILFDGGEIGLPGMKFGIFWGRDEADLSRRLNEKLREGATRRVN